MFELAQKPHYQDKIREEVKAFEKTVEPGYEFTYNDLKNFRYARACIEVPPVFLQNSTSSRDHQAI